jgi:hypothetical protein
VHIFKDDMEPNRYTWAITRNNDEDDLWYDDSTYSSTKSAKKEAEKILSDITKRKN